MFSAARLSILKKPLAVIGPPRSDVNTKRDPVSCSRLIRAKRGSQSAQWLQAVIIPLAPDHSDLQSARFKIHLLPAKRYQFWDAQAVPERHQDHSGVAMTVTIALAGCITELFYFVPGQPLAPRRCLIFIRSARCMDRDNCPGFSVWPLVWLPLQNR